MSLFVGNIANSVSVSDLEPVFEEFGPCRIKIQPNKSYGFVDFEQERDAEEALQQLKGKNVKGQEIRLEWSARSGKNKELAERNRDRRSDRSRYDSDRRNPRNSGCYGCGSHSHKLIDCPKKRGSYRRSRSNDRYSRRRSRSRSRSRSRDDYRRSQRKRHDSRSRSRSRDRSRDRSRENDRSKSRSRSNDRRRRRASSDSSRK